MSCALDFLYVHMHAVGVSGLLSVAAGEYISYVSMILASAWQREQMPRAPALIRRCK